MLTTPNFHEQRQAIVNSPEWQRAKAAHRVALDYRDHGRVKDREGCAALEAKYPELLIVFKRIRTMDKGCEYYITPSQGVAQKGEHS